MAFDKKEFIIDSMNFESDGECGSTDEESVQSIISSDEDLIRKTKTKIPPDRLLFLLQSYAKERGVHLLDKCNVIDIKDFMKKNTIQ